LFRNLHEEFPQIWPQLELEDLRAQEEVIANNTSKSAPQKLTIFMQGFSPTALIS